MAAGSGQIVSPYSGVVGVLGGPRSGATGQRVKREVIVKGEPEDTGEGKDREERRRGDPPGFNLAERLDRDAGRRCHYAEGRRPACGAEDGTEASTAFDLPWLQRVSDHARMIIPV